MSIGSTLPNSPFTEVEKKRQEEEEEEEEVVEEQGVGRRRGWWRFIVEYSPDCSCRQTGSAPTFHSTIFTLLFLPCVGGSLWRVDTFSAEGTKFTENKKGGRSPCCCWSCCFLSFFFNFFFWFLDRGTLDYAGRDRCNMIGGSWKSNLHYKYLAAAGAGYTGWGCANYVCGCVYMCVHNAKN